MSSGSGSDSESNRSVSPTNTGPAPTPGHNLESPPSNTPKSHQETPVHSPRSATPVSNRSGSRSPSGESRKSRSRSSTPRSKKSRSRSASAGSRSASGSPASRKSGSASPVSRKSRSVSAGSRKSRSKTRSRSASEGSKRSGSHRSRASSGSNRSRSASNASNRSADSNRSKKSGSRTQNSSRSHSPNLEIDDETEEKRKRDSSEEETPQRKRRTIASDSEEDKDKEKEVSAAAIFGDADDISSEEEKENEKQDEMKDDDETAEKRHSETHEMEQDVERVGDMENDEDKENEPEPIPETRIDVEIPKISCDLGRDIHFVKLPNFLSVETRPFDPETYEDEIDEEETLDEEGRARLKLKVENTIRWRDQMDKDGNIKKQSNARMVRWSDGSYSLHLGSEIFDVYKQPLQGDHNHLFIRQGTGLQGQAVFRTKLSFRPHSTESFTHRKMTLSLADRSQKTSGIKILSQVGLDPDHDRKSLLKKEEEKLKQTFKTSKPRKKDSGTRLHNSSSIYREEDGSDEDGAISLNAIKNKYKSGVATSAKGGAIYSSDEEGSDIEARRARKVDKTKALKDSESSEESE